jgi:hypothetical protein
MGCYADKPDECGNVDKGFNPLHAGQTSAWGFVPE